jgi:hypothetical protein
LGGSVFVFAFAIGVVRANASCGKSRCSHWIHCWGAGLNSVFDLASYGFQERIGGRESDTIFGFLFWSRTGRASRRLYPAEDDPARGRFLTGGHTYEFQWSSGREFAE